MQRCPSSSGAAQGTTRLFLGGGGIAEGVIGPFEANAVAVVRHSTLADQMYSA